MLRLKFLNIVFLVFGACHASNDGRPAATTGARCFDCDYDYAEGVGLTLRGFGREEDSSQIPGKSRGFRQCAFIRTGDRNYVSDTQCSSGTCFIRKDTNGLVYRGCADPTNLPIHVNISVNCQPQGPDSSIWWFCRGSLCNSGAFGSGDICWVPGQVPPVEDRHLPAAAAAAPSSNASGGQSSGKTLIGKLSTETFEQIQARAGFGNLRPVEYGGSGLNSEQTHQYFRNHSATAERGNLQFHGGQNPPSKPSADSRNPTSSSNSSYVYASSSFVHGKRPATETPFNLPVQPALMNSTDVNLIQGSSSGQKSSSWQVPVALAPEPAPELAPKPAPKPAPEPAPEPNWPKSWNSDQSQYSAVTQRATSDGSRLPEPQVPIPAYKTWNPELENGLGASARTADQQQITESKPQGVDAGLSASKDNARSWNNVWSQSQSTGSRTGSSSSAERRWEFTAFQPSIASATGHQQQQQQQQQQGGSAEGRTFGGSDTEIQFIFNSRFNPCDGVCADNPSGLYNHPAAPNWFVQCGPAFDGGIACQCCRPHYQQCPRGTFFNSATKVCDEGSNVDFNAIDWQPISNRRFTTEEKIASSATGEQGNYFRVPVEGKNVATSNGRVQSWSNQFEVPAQAPKPKEPPSAGKSSGAYQGSPVDQSSRRVDGSSASSTYVQSEFGASFNGIIPPLIVPGGGLGNEQQQQQYQQRVESTGGRISASDADLQFIFSSSYNPCDGVCADNPSGLYNHPSSPNWFVQCGPGFDGGVACQCCRPHYHQCPRGTVFSSATKVCDADSSLDSNPTVDHQSTDQKPDTWNSEVSGRNGHWNYVQQPSGKQTGVAGAGEGRWVSAGMFETPPKVQNFEAPTAVGRKSWYPDLTQVPVDSNSAHLTSGRQNPPEPNLPASQSIASSSGTVKQQDLQRSGEIPGSEADIQFIFNSRYNPCDGVCADNPSGLYNHPSAPNWFVQCGPAFEGGVACQCCRPHYHQCPRGTVFSSATKVCEGGNNARSP